MNDVRSRVLVFASGTINKKQFTKEETGLDLTHAYYPSKSLFSKENITTFIVPAYGKPEAATARALHYR
jgi:hypothetical protein